jgi:hypothetical protein
MNRLKFFKISVIIFLQFALAYPSLASNVSLIGVLEHKYTNYPHWPPRENPEYRYKIRVMFYKTDSTWEVMLDQKSINKYYPAEVLWTIAFDVRNLGNIESVDDPDSSKFYAFYARDRFHIPTKKFPIPEVGKVTPEFTGWLGGETLRPLILVNTGRYKDPDRWKPFKPKRDILSLLFHPLRKSISNLVRVDYATGKKTPFEFQEKDIKIFKSYKSLSNSKLIQLGFGLQHIDCGGKADPECPPRWFYVPNNGSPIYIGKEMKVVDAGDYDGDGTSEVIFWKQSYNLDGYVLFFDGFKRKAQYLWGYH